MKRSRILPIDYAGADEVNRHQIVGFSEQDLIDGARRIERICTRATLVILAPWFIWFAWQVLQGLAAKGLLTW